MDGLDEKLTPSTPAPPRKRRRTGKACASCRRRKTRCDGGMPCEACRIGEMGCSYDEPDRRMTAVEYIQSLERKVEELEGLLSRNGTTDSLADDASTPPTPKSGQEDKSSRLSISPSTPPKKEELPTSLVIASGKSSAAASDEDVVIETMVGADERASSERYRGSFAGLSLLKRVHNLCKHVSATRKNSVVDSLQDDFSHAFDFQSPVSDSSLSADAFVMLPSRDNFNRAIEIVVDQACCNMQFLDRSALEQTAREVYAENEEEPKRPQRKPLSLIYAVLALARRFEHVPTSAPATAHNIGGLRYFRASRSLLDPADCQDLVSLQALLCMILYTQVSSMMSTCYSYICMAVAAALQMGLFTEDASKDLPESEKLYRRRIFAVLNIMDTYVTTALGLPRTLRDVESDHLMPSRFRPASLNDPMAGTFAHAELIQILASAVESNHPVTRKISQKNGFYGVEYSKITATEEQLEAWFETLPQNPADASTPAGVMQMRSQLLLRLAYAHVQMVLYRPFLHHALKNMRSNSRISLKAYACGSACIKAAMQVVWLVETLESFSVFNEAHWFSTFIVSFTAACLVLFVMSNEGDPTLKETEEAVRRIKGFCQRHANENPSFSRCYKFLESLQPSEPTPEHEARNPFDAWNREVSTTFSEAYRLSDDADLESQRAQGEDLLQALSLPQLRSFLNSRI